MRPPFAALAIAGLLALAAPAAASALVVPLDQSTRLTIPGSAASVLVGDPDIASVTVVDSHTLYLQGKSYGVTNVIVLDSHGRTLYSGDVKVEAPGESVAVYHGSNRVDVACSPRCAPSSAPTAGDLMTAAFNKMIGSATSQAAATAANTGGIPPQILTGSGPSASTSAKTP